MTGKRGGKAFFDVIGARGAHYIGREKRMAKDFAKTSMTLLSKIAADKTGDDESVWARFFDLYQPAMLVFARGLGGNDDAEDVVQNVLVKLVEVLRGGKYERQDGKSFRAYVKTLVRNQLHDLYRRETIRGRGLKVELTDAIADETPEERRDLAAALDEEWAAACRTAATEHVLTRTAMSEKSKAIYRAYAVEGRPIAEVAREFGVPRNSVSQVKTRVERMIGAIAAEYGD